MPRARLKQSPKPEPTAGLALLCRPLLLSALFALAAGLAPPSVAQRQSPFSLSARPESITVCPGRPAQVRLSLAGPEGSFEYRWEAEAGRIKGDGPTALWNLSGVKPGTYTAGVTVTLESSLAAPQSLKREVKVVVRECAEAPPSCPDIKLDCPKSVEEGTPATLTAEVSGGGQPLDDVSYLWSVSPDAPATRDDRIIKVDTKGLGGHFIVGTFEVAGYGRKCVNRCRTLVEPTPTPSPSPTPFLVGSPSPTPAGPLGSLSPTPPATPTPAAVAPPQADDEGGRFFAWNSWLIPILLALALTLWGLLHASRKTREISFGGGRDLIPDWLDRVLGRMRTAPGREERPEEPGGQTKEAVEEAAAGAGAVRGGTDELHCTVYAPFGAAPGDGFLVQAFAHLAADAARLTGLAREAQQNAERRGSRALGAVARGQELGFHLQMPGLEVDEPSQSVVWRGEIETVQFGVNVPEDFRPRAVNCKLTVTSGSVPLGHIRFTFNVAEAAAPTPEPDAAPLARHKHFVRYRQAFISYASEDRAEVLRCVQMLTLLKIECFQDVLSLEPGQRWQEGIYRKLAASDVLFLFWSSAASKSEWVEKEVRYALGLKAGDDERPPEIVPVILQGPPEVPPPAYLPELHFNDPFAYFIRAEAAMRRAAEEG